ncbi:MAG TPA: endopeptidase La [Candidatus Limnocylindrales bacterium]|nr:endopeptidase La [Candidatus Limnocylindrales bacterium]
MEQTGISEPTGLGPSEKDKAVLPPALAILPLRDSVLYPKMVLPLVVGKERSIKLVDDALMGDRIIGVTALRDSKIENPEIKDLYTVGTAAIILKMIKMPDGSLRLLIQGLSRIRIQEYIQTEPYYRAKVEAIPDQYTKDVRVEALTMNVRSLFQKVVSMAPYLSDEIEIMALNIQEPSELVYLIASSINISTQERQEILELQDIRQQLERITFFLNRELEIMEVREKIQSQIKGEMDKSQREYYLREQLKAIQKELGEKDERTLEIEEFKEKIEKANMPPEAKEAAERELNRLAKMPPAAAEYTVSRTYLEWLVELPWSISTEDNLDIESAQKVLDEDHYDLERVKKRILEYLAVRKLKKDMKGPILCFLGPPGVGKTSLGRSIARALGRKFVRVSLGGVRDEAEIRGHRRTYIGALPGRIIQGIRKAGSNNPVFMLDEIDKVGTDFRGDPSSALLEVLDPEQNYAFSDHYLEVPFDLSKVMFIATANVLDTIPPALRDRMEVLDLPGYTEEEKLMIAKTHLLPKQLEAHGLEPRHLQVEDEALRLIIRSYTREAGVRNLERQIATICRGVAKEVALGKETTEVITPDKVPQYLGPIKFFSEVAERTSVPGIATGLAWTPVGGDILFVEATMMRGGKNLILTGQLGDVMKESAQAALSYIRSKAKDLGIPEDFYEKNDIHIHVPAGSIPKDGPSAGVTMMTALASLLTGRPVRSDVAMTGEITLRGQVLPVGGIKEKVLAAKQAGITTVILPKKNEKDLEEVPEHIKKDIKFLFVQTMDEVLEVALEKNQSPKGKHPKAKVAV